MEAGSLEGDVGGVLIQPHSSEALNSHFPHLHLFLPSLFWGNAKVATGQPHIPSSPSGFLCTPPGDIIIV